MIPLVFNDINIITDKLPLVLDGINTIADKLPVILKDPNNITKIPIEHKAEMLQ